MLKEYKLGIHYLIILLLLGSTWTATAQGVMYMEAAADSVELGTPTTVTLDLRLPTGYNVQAIDFATLDSTPNILAGKGGIFTDDYLDWSPVPTSSVSLRDKRLSADQLQVGRVNDEQVVKVPLSMVLYSPGIFELAYPRVKASPSMSWQTGAKARIVVLPPDAAQQGVSLTPIRDIVVEEKNWTDYWPYYIAVALLLVAAAVWRWLSRRSQEVEVATAPPIEEPKRPAHEIALQALDELDRRQLWQKGEIKAYQSELTDIMRNYLSDRYGIPAMEQTTGEIKSALQQIDIKSEQIDQVMHVLQVADMVKFAKARPDESVHQQFLERARQLVHETQEIKREAS